MLRQLGDLGVLRAAYCGFPSLPCGGFGLIGVASDPSVVAAWRIGSESPMSALGCGFNWSTQHLISKYREEDVVHEAATEDLLHRRTEIVDVGSLAERRVPSFNSPAF